MIVGHTIQSSLTCPHLSSCYKHLMFLPTSEVSLVSESLCGLLTWACLGTIRFLNETVELVSGLSVQLSSWALFSSLWVTAGSRGSYLPSISSPYSNASYLCSSVSSVQLLSCVRLFATPWIAAHQASLSITNSWSSPKLICIESVMPSSHLILCCPLLLLTPIPPSIRVFSNESTLHKRWPKYWSFSFRIIPSKEHLGWSALEWTGWISLQSKGLSRVFSNTTVQKHQFFCTQVSLQSDSHI